MDKQNHHIWYTRNTGHSKKGDSGVSSLFGAWLRLRRPQLESFSHGLAVNISLLGDINLRRNRLISKCDDPQASDWNEVWSDLSNVMHKIESDIPDDAWNALNALEKVKLKHELLERLRSIRELHAMLDLDDSAQIEESSLETSTR